MDSKVRRGAILGSIIGAASGRSFKSFGIGAAIGAVSGPLILGGKRRRKSRGRSRSPKRSRRR